MHTHPAADLALARSTLAPLAGMVAATGARASRPLPVGRAAAVLMLPITHPLVVAAAAHAALAGLLVWALLMVSGAAPGADEAVACATPLALTLLLAAATCPHQTPRCHALRLLVATAVAPALLLGWAATQPMALAPVVVALGLTLAVASHASAFAVGVWRLRHRSPSHRLA